jgi:hypothetical protein
MALWLFVSSLGGPAFAADETSSRATVEEAPSDHPVLPSGHLELPPPPASFNTYDAGWIRFSYPPDTRERLEPLIAEADSFRRELSERLGQQVLDRVHVYVARTPGEMSTLAPSGAPYPRYASGVAYSELGLVLLTIASQHPGERHDLLEVFKHELAHVALFDAIGKRHAVPRWFNEGFAVHASGESSVARLQTLWTATLSGNLLPLGRLQGGFPADGATAGVAYAQSADIVRFLMRQSDTSRFVALMARLRRGEDFESALKDAYGLDRASLEYEWREDVARRYSFWPVFFSGSIVWMGVIGLFAMGWRRRRQKARTTLAKWSREEAALDRARAAEARARELAEGGPTVGDRVHIIFPVHPSARPGAESPSRSGSPTPVPKVEHDGNWHTLH